MTKIIEVPDIAQWEETDSELAKYTIGKLSRELDVSIKVAKSLAQDLEKAETIIDKAIHLIKRQRNVNGKLDKYNVDDLLSILRGEDNE